VGRSQKRKIKRQERRKLRRLLSSQLVKLDEKLVANYLRLFGNIICLIYNMVWSLKD
jgi:hypothetical protein